MPYIPLTITKLGIHFPNPLGFFPVVISLYNKHPAYYHFPDPWKVSIIFFTSLIDKHPAYLYSNP